MEVVSIVKVASCISIFFHL